MDKPTLKQDPYKRVAIKIRSSSVPLFIIFRKIFTQRDALGAARVARCWRVRLNIRWLLRCCLNFYWTIMLAQTTMTIDGLAAACFETGRDSIPVGQLVVFPENFKLLQCATLLTISSLNIWWDCVETIVNYLSHYLQEISVITNWAVRPVDEMNLM